MTGRAVDLAEIIQPENLANQITDLWITWNNSRAGWLSERKEQRNYVFATDTRTTSNSKLPWKNSTTIPKLTQIRDNIHANYMAALFPNDKWFVWEGDDESSEEIGKRTSIEAYMRNKVQHGEFTTIISKLLYDYIDSGNVFCTSEYVVEQHDGKDNQPVLGFVGPRAVRISPYDIVFNPLVNDFQNSPKIIRSIKTLGELRADVQEKPEQGYLLDVFNKTVANRERVTSMSDSDIAKNEAFVADGFGSIREYYGSDYVELLEFYGDIYDRKTGEFLPNHILTVVDRAYVIRKIPDTSWLGKRRFQHAGWRLRPDNLWAMGPLDNLVGMQYRIDHLENLKADVFDLIAHPVMKIVGDVEEFDYGPGERIYVGDEGDVVFMSPDVTSLNADTQIAILEQKMEEMAGAPRQAMGIRTPGEKTKFEIQTLENAVGRIFQNKVDYFERKVIEPLLNQMLAQARENLDTSDIIRVMDNETDAVLFPTITVEDITAKGKLRPVGARHFAHRANMLQNLTQLSNTALMQDDSVKVHFSGFRIAKLIEELLEVEEHDIVEKDIRIFEQAETASKLQQEQTSIDKQAIESDEDQTSESEETLG